MDEALHAGFDAGFGDALRQLHVSALESGFFLGVKNTHQIDHGVAAADEARERSIVVDVGFHDVDGRQHQQELGAFASARRHDHFDAEIGKAFGDMVADEPAPPQ